MPPTPRRVVPLLLTLGEVAGHRFTLLSLEIWDTWFDLRFARVDLTGARPLPRRVPPAGSWTVRGPGNEAFTVVDVVGRGDRAFSNGEARVEPALPHIALRLEFEVVVLDDHPPLTAAVVIPAS